MPIQERCPPELPSTDLAANPDWQDCLSRTPFSLIYKHSPMCSLSFMALAEVTRFARTNPDVPIYLVDVVRSRAFSRRLAERLGIPHASPQVMLLRLGASVWSASHERIDAEAIDAAVRGAADAPPVVG